MSVTHVQDHADQAVALLLSQDQDDPGTVGLLRALMSGVQRLEDDLFDLDSAFDIDTATGAILDRMGAWVDEPRGASPDGEYRRAIKIKLFALTSAAVTQDAVRIAEDLTDPSTVTTWAMPPAGLQLQVYTDLALTETTASRLARFLEIVRPAGVSLHGIRHDITCLVFDEGSYDTEPMCAERI